MYTSHKEKERLRHQKQVKLLNQVMQHVPQFSNEPQTKVRKLRRLILYTHYLRMVHSEVTKKFAKTDEIENSVMKKAIDLTSDFKKSPCKPLKNLRSKRANIVFLQADKSLNSTRKTQKNCIHGLNSQCNNEESTVVSTSNECKIPKLVPIKDVMSMQFDPEATCISENAYHSQIDNDCTISLKDQETSKSESINVDKQTIKNLESSSPIRSLSEIDKESYKPIVSSHVTDEDELNEEFSLYNSPASLFSDNASLEKLKSNKFLVNSEQNYNILKESKFSNNENINKFPHFNMNVYQESLLNSPNSEHIQNVCPDYSFFSLPNESQITHPFYYNFYQSDFPFNLVPKMLPKNDLSLSGKNAFSDTSSCSSNDKISVDIENVSDSHPSCSSDSSNSVQYSFYDTYPAFGHSQLTTEKKPHSVGESVVSEPMGINYTTLSMHSPNYTCMEKNMLRYDNSNMTTYDIPYSYVNSTYPHSIPFHKSAYGVPFFSETSLKDYRKYENKNYVNPDSFYLPPFNDSFHKDNFLVQPKFEVEDSPYGSESFCKENIKPSVFEEEVSYPLSHYF